MSIPMTQYLMPDGRTRIVDFDGSPKTEKLAAELTAVGTRFEVEVLTTGQVSFEAVIDVGIDDPKSLAHEICDNGPGVPEVVERLVREAHARATREKLL